MATKASKKGAGAAKGGGPNVNKKRMTKTELYNALAERTGKSRKEAQAFLDTLTEIALGEVKAGGEFVLPGFGKLVLGERKAREGRNPATGETITIPAKTTLKFRVAKTLKDSLLPAK